MHLPAWSELIDEQRSVLEAPLDDSLFVVGPPGSGKTVLAVERARMLAGDDRSVAIVTFNRMLRRLVGLLDGPGPETMQTFVGRDYHSRTKEFVPKLSGQTHAFDWPAVLAALDGHERGGHALHHLVIDEGQDLAAEFFTYAERHVAPAMTVFADDDQAIGKRHTSVEEIRAATSLPSPIILSENHRNVPEVAAVAEHFHSGRLPAATVRRGATAERPRLIQGEDVKAACRRIATWLQTRGGTVGVVVDRNTTATEVHGHLEQLLPGRRVDLYSHTLKNDASIQLLEPGVTILNQESVKGQEFDTVFILELERFIPCNTDSMKRVMYMLCARARDTLFLMSDRQLSAAAEASLPDQRLLERR